MTREDFFDIGSEVFTEYLAKVKGADRKLFLDALFDELLAREAISEDSEESSSDDIENLFDSYE